jgi:hypothetical protein
MRKICSGLLYCAMLKVYDNQKATLNQYFTQQGAKPNILANFILNLVSNFFDAKLTYPAYFNQYCQILLRFATLGIEAKEFLLRCKMIGRLL